MSPDSHNNSPEAPKVWKWTKPKELAAKLLAEDELTDDQIAERCGVVRRSLAKWKVHPEFKVRVSQNVDAYRKRILSSGLAVRENRVKLLERLALGHVQVLDERAARPGFDDSKKIPGGRTGLVVLQYRGQDPNGNALIEQMVDTGIVQSLRLTLAQISDEVKPLGEQRADRIDELIHAIKQPIQAAGTGVIAEEDLVRPGA